MLFWPGDPELKALKLKSHNLSLEYSNTREDETERRAQILKEMVGGAGENVFIQGPVFFHYGLPYKYWKPVLFNSI